VPPNPAWSYSDWDTNYTAGSAAQLARLKLHIQEITDRISTGNYSNPKGSHDKNVLLELLKLREADRNRLEASVGVSSGIRSPFTRGRSR
jgi:hypothetical protein